MVNDDVGRIFDRAEESAQSRHAIGLEEIARASAFSLVQWNSINHDAPVDVEGDLVRIYFPVDLAVTFGPKKSFQERLKMLDGDSADEGLAKVSYLVGSTDLKSLNSALREAELQDKSRLFKRYMKRYGKDYDLVVVTFGYFPIRGDQTSPDLL
ncbi:MAG: hypothetical protein ABIA93_06900 [Candidatus Woesearchaeota archaeon]